MKASSQKTLKFQVSPWKKLKASSRKIGGKNLKRRHGKLSKRRHEKIFAAVTIAAVALAAVTPAAVIPVDKREGLKINIKGRVYFNSRVCFR